MRPPQTRDPDSAFDILLAARDASALPRLERVFQQTPLATRAAASLDDAERSVSPGACRVLVVDDEGAPREAMQLCATLRKHAPHALCILITAARQLPRAAHALALGEIDGAVARPVDPDLLREQVAHGLARRADRAALRRAARPRRDTEAGAGALAGPAVTALCRAIEARDPATRAHGERVARLARRIGERLGLAAGALERLELAARLHDIGKLGVPDAVLHKPAALDRGETARVRRHAAIGAEILGALPCFEDVAASVRHHHEWFDGSALGYPDRLAGDAIPLASRVILCADTLDAMTTDRPYRRARPLDEAAAEIERCAGTQLDPGPASLLLELVAEHGDALLDADKRDPEPGT